jgi:hypothetical protein
MASAQKELVKVWGADGVKPDSPQMKAAHRAFMAYAPPALRTVAEMDKIGNNPIVLQILASVGAEMKEDTRLHGEGGQGDDVQKLMNSEPYWNKKHPEHASTVKRVNEFFAAGGKVAARGVTNNVSDTRQRPEEGARRADTPETGPRMHQQHGSERL